jgi:hypothetical protein
MPALCAVLALALGTAPRMSLGQTSIRRTARELDSMLVVLRNPDWSRSTDTLLATAVRYATEGSRMTRIDSIRAIASFIAAAHSGDALRRLRVSYLAMRIPLAEFAPMLRGLADSPGDQSDREERDDDAKTPGEFVRDAAVGGFVALAPTWLLTPPPTLVATLDRDVAASCLDTPASLRIPCTSMRTELRRFRLHMSNSDSARVAIKAFQRSLTRAAHAGLPVLTVLLLTANASLLEQSTFHVEVQPRVVGTSGDSITMAYTVRVISPASDGMDDFIVDAPAYVRVMQPGKGWRIGSLFDNRVAASWYRNGLTLFKSGQSTPPLPVMSYGVLGLVPFLAERYEPLQSGYYEHATDSTIANQQVEEHGARGFTVGVVPFPQDLAPQALANRLGGLIDRTCELGWIDDPRTCAELRASAKAAPTPLRALLDGLERERGKHVSEPAYLLLQQNVRFLSARL